MLTWLTKRAQRKANAHNLYGSIVALSLAPALYDKLHVPDEIENRFEVLVFHMFACLKRLNGEELSLAQNIVDKFFSDMDTTSRELGVGDVAVPKKMRGLAAVFDERMAAYKTATEATDKKTLTNQLKQNIYGATDPSLSSTEGLDRYARDLMQTLANTSLEDLMTGQIKAPAINGKIQ
jgi:cytochrome b pre-mRNA-processing protein 3